MLLGIFTGKTQSLGLKENLLPIASIVAGIFVKNPMLKMLLIGLGGANLLNKAGHEALGKERTERNGNVATTDKKVQYRRYPDEPLQSTYCESGTARQYPYCHDRPRALHGAA